jgi:hypothetical protein
LGRRAAKAQALRLGLLLPGEVALTTSLPPVHYSPFQLGNLDLAANIGAFSDVKTIFRNVRGLAEKEPT